MIKRKHGAGLVVVAALAMMAFAANAQAVAPGFLINKVAVGMLLATIGGEQVGRGTLLVQALNFELNCEKFTVVEGAIESNTDATGKLLYEQCTALSITKLPETQELPCKVIVDQSPLDEKLHVSASALILPAELKNGAPAILAENISALILFKSGTGCPLPLDNLVTGELCLAIDGNDTVRPLVLASEAIQGECRARTALHGGTEIASVEEAELREALKTPTAFLDELLYGAQKSFVDGTAHVFLTGEHESEEGAGKEKFLGVSLY